MLPVILLGPFAAGLHRLRIYIYMIERTWSEQAKRHQSFWQLGIAGDAHRKILGAYCLDNMGHGHRSPDQGGHSSAPKFSVCSETGPKEGFYVKINGLR